MTLSLVAGTLALVPRNTTNFLGRNGTPPYTYSVLPGGAGGSIDSSTGLYTSPNSTSFDPKKAFDTVVVTDSLAAIAQLQILVGTPLMLVCDIIQKEMDLEVGQVYVWDQKINIPIDEKLYIAIENPTCKPFGNSNTIDGSGPGLVEVQSTNFQATLSIDILSRGVEARDRKEEIVLALGSTYAEQQQEINGFYIGRISTNFVNLSQVDGAAIPYRYNISVNIQYQVTKTKSIDYYDTFTDPEILTDP